MSIRGKEIELQLLGWGESHNSGCKVTFAVHPADLEYFKNKTERKGKVAGQIFMAVLVEVDEAPAKPSVAQTMLMVDEQANIAAMDAQVMERRIRTSSHFPGGLCGLAVRWCADLHFHEWLMTNYGAEWNTACTEIGDRPDDIAKLLVCDFCKVDSRKQLDTSPGADLLFNKYIREPYREARKADGIEE